MVTLDDMTLDDMSSQLGVPVNVSHDSILEVFNDSRYQTNQIEEAKNK